MYSVSAYNRLTIKIVTTTSRLVSTLVDANDVEYVNGPAATKEIDLEADSKQLKSNIITKIDLCFNLSHPDLKALAYSLGLKRSQNKSELATTISEKWENRVKLEGILSASSSSLSNFSGNFKSDENTFFRICNFLMVYPDAVARSAALAGRKRLQESKNIHNL